MLTLNERKVLRFLMVSYKYYSINDIAKECKLSPNGSYKILKKLENEGILYSGDIGKIKAYKINFKNAFTMNYLELALSDDRIKEPRIKVRMDDFKKLMEICQAAIIFGSYITEKKNPDDTDIIFVITKDNYKIYKKEIDRINEIIPYKIHEVIQTKEDIINNLKKQDKIVINAIKEGLVLWGHDIIARSIKDAQN